MALLDDILGLIFPAGKYGARSTTRLGVRVRSRAEQTIADYLESIGVRYEYERELFAHLWIFRRKVSCPDFHLPDYDIYVEYWGMLDVKNDYDRRKYERSMKYKMARYHELGIKFISLYPRDLPNLDAIFRAKFADLTGKILPPLKSARTGS